MLDDKMATLPSEMVGHSPFLPDPAAAYAIQDFYLPLLP